MFGKQGFTAGGWVIYQAFLSKLGLVFVKVAHLRLLTKKQQKRPYLPHFSLLVTLDYISRATTPKTVTMAAQNDVEMQYQSTTEQMSQAHPPSEAASAEQQASFGPGLWLPGR